MPNDGTNPDAASLAPTPATPIQVQVKRQNHGQVLVQIIVKPQRTDRHHTVMPIQDLGRKHFNFHTPGLLQCFSMHPSFIALLLSYTWSKPMVHTAVLDGKTNLIAIVDGGPDWRTASLLNAFLYMQLWRDCDLDLLVTSFAACYSAYNPIEHWWSPLRKNLNSVRLKAIDGDDQQPPFISCSKEWEISMGVWQVNQCFMWRILEGCKS